MRNLASARILLRPVELGDVGPAHELLSQWNVVRYMLLPLCSREESEKFILSAMEDAGGEPWRSTVRAIQTCAGEFAGLCGIVVLRGTEEGEIWYLLNPRFWNQGLGTEAASILIEYGFTRLGLHRVWATCLPENPASARVLEKAGMRREGLIKKNLKIHGEWKDCFLYAMLDDEWRHDIVPATNHAARLEENKSTILRYIDRLVNNEDPSIADELLAPDYVDHAAPQDHAAGPAVARTRSDTLPQNMNHIRAFTEDVIAEGDRVVTRHRSEAVRAGSRVEWTTISIYRVVGGKIAERWEIIGAGAPRSIL